MNDPFESPKERLERAREHIDDIDRLAIKFFSENPYTQFTENDPIRNVVILKARLHPIPKKIVMRTCEAGENLRAALDQTGYVTALLGGIATPKKSYFPFADSETEISNVVKGRCKDIPTDILKLFLAFQPWKRDTTGTGNDLLWAINQLANRTKHRIRIIPQITVDRAYIRQAIMSGGAAIFPGEMPFNSSKGQVTIGEVPVGGSLYNNFNLIFTVKFAEINPLVGRSVVNTLKDMASIVDSIIAGTEAECRRIGLMP